MLVAYHSFQGRFSDSPRAVFERLAVLGGDHEHVWLSAAGHEHGFPEGVRQVGFGTPQGRELLEAADLLVANTYTDVPWTKRPGARYLQTWHGTPLKHIHWASVWAPAELLEPLDVDVARWDVLLSSSHRTTDYLRHAFRFDGDVVATGYPRNDVLSSPHAGAIRARVRERLGIPEGARAVLYAPTWRDDEFHGVDGAAFGLRLDPARLADALGEDDVLVLRLHYLLTGRLAALEHPRVVDASWWPDMAELHLAADALVTDYSSTMFDFAVLGRPIVLYAYDVERYATAIRGFALDLEAERPGPLVTTEDELVDALRDGRGDPARLAAFRERWCDLDDGGATDRVLAHLGLLPVSLRAPRPR